MTKKYSNYNVNTVIKMLLRVVKLYQGYSEMMRILTLIIKIEQTFKNEKKLALELREKKESEETETFVIRCVSQLRRLLRLLTSFKEEHKIFKEFIFRG